MNATFASILAAIAATPAPRAPVARPMPFADVPRPWHADDPIGRGPTEQAAMADLLEQEDGGCEPDYTDETPIADDHYADRAAADWWAGRTA